MQRDPVNSANDAKAYAQSGNIQQAIVSLADAVQGIAEYQRYIRNDQFVDSSGVSAGILMLIFGFSFRFMHRRAPTAHGLIWLIPSIGWRSLSMSW